MEWDSGDGKVLLGGERSGVAVGSGDGQRCGVNDDLGWSGTAEMGKFCWGKDDRGSGERRQG
jgi:hypothetical protein